MIKTDHLLVIERDIISYMKEEKNLSDEELKEVLFIISLMDEADDLKRMEERYL